MLPSYFDYIFGHLRQKAHLRPELSPKFLPTLDPNPARTRLEPDPKSPARLTTLMLLDFVYVYTNLPFYFVGYISGKKYYSSLAIAQLLERVVSD